MPDFLRWIIAGVTSVVVAGLVFLLATVGIVVAFFVFLVLFVVFGLAMRRARKNVQYGEDGSRFIIIPTFPELGRGMPTVCAGTIPTRMSCPLTNIPWKRHLRRSPATRTRRPLEITGNRDGVPGRQVFSGVNSLG